MTALMSRIETHGDKIKYAPLGLVAFSQETREISSKLIFIRDLQLVSFVNSIRRSQTETDFWRRVFELVVRGAAEALPFPF